MVQLLLRWPFEGAEIVEVKDWKEHCEARLTGHRLAAKRSN